MDLVLIQTYDAVYQGLVKTIRKKSFHKSLAVVGVYMYHVIIMKIFIQTLLMCIENKFTFAFQ